MPTRTFWQFGSRLFAIMALVCLALSFGAPPAQAQAQTWTLTPAMRRAYLYYYAPVILKRGDENNDKEGRDWLTNFDFDRDGNFSTNRVNWLKIDNYVAASAGGPSSYDRWRIRPTLYSALVEYMEGSSKSLLLLYHVYNAADKDGSQIHDWERIEIVVRNITGTPGGSGEYVNHATVTLHHEHIMRRYYDSELNFMQTATGKHVLIWQADESNAIPPATHAHELRFVANPYSWIASQMNSLYTQAEVNISGKDEKKNVHYVFVPEGSPAAVSAWGARPLSYTTASTLASRVDNGDTRQWNQVKRITYEIQDLADIFPTHWRNNPWYTHWLSSDSEDVLLESPILNEAGQPEVSTGLQRFYTQSRDAGASDLTDGRSGIPDKGWFYGVYSAELNSDLFYTSDGFEAYEGLGLDSYGRSRGAASGYYNSHNAFWWQHDLFVHSGVINTAKTREAGMWLPGAWYTAANGGFDGRWVQLFDDRPNDDGGVSGTLTGTVTNASTGAVLTGATVAATTGSTTYSATTNSSGVYQMTLPAGTYSVTASKTGYTSKTVTGVVVSSGATTTRNFALSPSTTTGTMSGTVTNASTGAALASATVVATTGSTTYSVQTNASGVYQMTLPSGSYSVTVSKTGYTSQAFSGVVVSIGATTTRDFSLTAVSSNGTLSGTVRDAGTGQPVAGATVTASTGTSSLSAQTDSNGQYSMTLASGTYSITASKTGYTSQTVSGVVVSSGATTTRNFVLSPSTTTGTLTGTVKDTDTSLPIQGATVTATAGSTTYSTTNTSGVYSLSLPAGTYSVRVSRTGYYLQTVSVAVSSGATTTQNFWLVVKEPIERCPPYCQSRANTRKLMRKSRGWRAGTARG